MAARAERRVDDGLARADGEELAHLVGEDGDVVSCACSARRSAACSALPSTACRCSSQAPGFQSSRWSLSARDDDLALEPGVAREDGRDEDPTLTVEVRLGRPREEEPAQLAGLARERVERGDAGLDGHSHVSRG